jgi:hypothetical protein
MELNSGFNWSGSCESAMVSGLAGAVVAVGTAAAGAAVGVGPQELMAKAASNNTDTKTYIVRFIIFSSNNIFNQRTAARSLRINNISAHLLSCCEKGLISRNYTADCFL